MAPVLSDDQLEQAIEAEYRALVAGDSEGEQRAAFNRMVALIRQRSPERIEAMERERGLR